ncbi:MAG TPA: tetratricopeptide repeat protein [Thermoanaerobaculia bacterium]|nr:tetratricopeptide repeat protein [Thermoanaerobaculia bacterium]
MTRAASLLLLCLALPLLADELQRAHELAWAKRFAEAEALYRRLPESPAQQLGLARVVMWQGRYAEAIALFEKLEGVDALEGLATAQYWSGDWRAAARNFRRVLALDPGRTTPLPEILATARPSQRVTVAGVVDDQPLELIRTEVAASLFSDPQTRWTVSLGRYDGDASGELASVANETTIRRVTVAGSLGIFTWPDGVRRPVGSASVRRGSLSARVERVPEIATATSFDTHVASTLTALRWETDRRWLAAAEVSHRGYSDDNQGWAAFAYAMAPLQKKEWTFWGGGAVTAKDTAESRFFDGRYDPYWTPEDLVEGRAVVAVQRGAIKAHADGGWARDRSRRYRPWRAGLTANVPLARDFRIEAGVERSVTIDYRATAFHVSLVRRR